MLSWRWLFCCYGLWFGVLLVLIFILHVYRPGESREGSQYLLHHIILGLSLSLSLKALLLLLPTTIFIAHRKREARGHGHTVNGNYFSIHHQVMTKTTN